jgi:hypothetical protein
MTQVPRVFPAGANVIEAFPLQPIPERLSAARADVLGQLALAHAPFSQRRTACILAGADEGYGGHVIEHSPTHIEDPFMMALEKVPEGARLYGIIVAGTGDMKEKHLLPSGKAYDAIAPLLFPGSPIIVIPPNQTDICRFIPEAQHQSAYVPKPLTTLEGTTFMQVYREAIRSTVLSAEDCAFIARLRLSGLDDSIHYYLTGSANGESGPSVALRPGLYRDLDIIAVSDHGKQQTEAAFEAVAQAHYGVLEKTPKVVTVAGTSQELEGCLYTNSAAGIAIDFFTAPALENAFVRPESYDRHYFHQLS